MHHHLASAKNILVDTLSSKAAFGHEINGKKTKPEGFVANMNGRPTKLVDRRPGGFSQINFIKNADRNGK